jgi:hypothetical protein
MRYIKTFEESNVTDEPQPNDYVITTSEKHENRIGTLQHINSDDTYWVWYKYDIPRHSGYVSQVSVMEPFYKNEIIFWNKNKEDLEKAIKYNL